MVVVAVGAVEVDDPAEAAAAAWPRNMSQPISTRAGTTMTPRPRIPAFSALETGIPKATATPTIAEMTCITSFEMYSGVNVGMGEVWQK